MKFAFKFAAEIPLKRALIVLCQGKALSLGGGGLVGESRAGVTALVGHAKLVRQQQLRMMVIVILAFGS